MSANTITPSITSHIFQFPFCVTYTSSLLLFTLVPFLFLYFRKSSTSGDRRLDASQKGSDPDTPTDKEFSRGAAQSNTEFKSNAAPNNPKAQPISSLAEVATYSSLIHATIASLSSVILVICTLVLPSHWVPSFMDLQSVQIDNLMGHSFLFKHVNMISFAYFTWDLAVSIILVFGDRSMENLSLLFYALVCLILYAIFSYPICSFLGVFFLLLEISTVFLDLGYISTRKGKYYRLFRNLFKASFGIIRILIALPATVYQCWQVYKRRNEFKSIVYLIITSGFSLSVLNSFWYYHIMTNSTRKQKKTKEI